MRVQIDLPDVVRRAVAAQVSAWDPRSRGPRMTVYIQQRMLVIVGAGESVPPPSRFDLLWSIGLFPTDGKRFWRVGPASEADAETIEELAEAMDHHFDDPLEGV